MTNAYINKIRQDFPILARMVNANKPLVYFDNASSCQKPLAVINALVDYYTNYNANTHRGIHALSEEATYKLEQSRAVMQNFINAEKAHECIFVRGTTEAINLVAASFGQQFIHQGDEILLSEMEHHANIVPWQLHAEKVGATIKVIPLTLNGELDLSKLDLLLSHKTKIVSIVHASNSLGTINPIKEIIQQAHRKNIPVCIDGAQSAANIKIDVQDLDCDFFTLSANKLYSPTGVGLLYGKEKWLEAMPPYHGGGHMIKQVTFSKTTFADLPNKFEAGTASIADLIAWGEGVKYFTNLDWQILNLHKERLVAYAQQQLKTIPGLQIIGNAIHKIPVISFIVHGIHPHDLSTILDQNGIAIRAGHHCTMPTMDFFKLAATARVSLAIYNTIEEVDKLVIAIIKAKKLFKK